MNVSKDVKSGFDKPYLLEQSCAAEIDIQMVSRRSMGDQDVGFEWNAVLPWCLCPLILEPAATLEFESNTKQKTHAKLDPPHFGIAGAP
jgi:hypothetical protein